MIRKKKAFIEILRVELEDLGEDIKLLISEFQQKYSKQEISNYVHLENVALLQNEIFGVEGFSQLISDIDVDGFDDIAHLQKELMDRFAVRIKEKGLAKSVMMLIERKMNKVCKYVEGR